MVANNLALAGDAVWAIIIVIVIATAAVTVVNHLDAALVLQLADTFMADFGSQVNKLADLILFKVVEDVEVVLGLFIGIAHFLDGITSAQVLSNLGPQLS